MSGVRSVQLRKDLHHQAPQPGGSAQWNLIPGSSIKITPLSTNYIANCRLCLGNQFGTSSSSIADERFSGMIKQLFPFPIMLERGLPMNVCTMCCKTVEVFYEYSLRVLSNQKQLKATLIPADQYFTKSKKKSQSKNRKEVKANMIDVDMQCETIIIDQDEDNQQHPLGNETHFVSVGTDRTAIETDECSIKLEPDEAEETPLVIEALSFGEEVYLESTANDVLLSDHNYFHTKNAAQNKHPLVQSETCEGTSFHPEPFVTKAQSVSKLEKTKNTLAGGNNFLNYAANACESDSSEDTDDDFFASMFDLDGPTERAERFPRAEHAALLFLEPVGNQAELEEFNYQLEDPNYMEQVMEYLMRETGQQPSVHLMHSAIDFLFTLEFFVTCSWSGVGIPHSKIPFKKHYKIVELFSKLGAEDGKKLPAHIICKYFKCKFYHAKQRLKKFKNLRHSAPRQFRKSGKSSKEPFLIGI